MKKFLYVVKLVLKQDILQHTAQKGQGSLLGLKEEHQLIIKEEPLDLDPQKEESNEVSMKTNGIPQQKVPQSQQESASQEELLL